MDIILVGLYPNRVYKIHYGLSERVLQLNEKDIFYSVVLVRERHFFYV